jgi:hypothetical protein
MPLRGTPKVLGAGRRRLGYLPVPPSAAEPSRWARFSQLIEQFGIVKPYITRRPKHYNVMSTASIMAYVACGSEYFCLRQYRRYR